MNLPSLECSWADLPKSILLVEDPVYATPIDITSYTDIYGAIVNTLDGKYIDSKVSCFFEVSHINQTLLVFGDAFKRSDFFEEARELGLLPGLNEIQAGEDEQDKLRRVQSEKAIMKQKAICMIKKTKSDGSLKQTKILESANKKLIDLNHQYEQLININSEESKIKKEKLLIKISKIKLILDKN